MSTLQNVFPFDHTTCTARINDAFFITVPCVLRGPGVNPRIIGYVHILLPNEGQNHKIRTANKSFEIVAKFKYLVTSIIKLNYIKKKKITGVRTEDKAPATQFRNFFIPVLCENAELKIFRTINPLVVWYGFENGLLYLGKNTGRECLTIGC
jgi:hypothetical protein